MINRKVAIAILITIISAAGFAYYHNKATNTYIVTRPTRGDAILSVYATGTVEASVMIPVAPRQSARLMELFADEGQKVQKGMIMAQLEDSDLQNALNDRKAALTLAEKEFERQSKLSKSGAISKQAYDKAQANLEIAKANAAQAEANLSFMKLISPEDGIVIRRDGEIGELIAANQPVLWLSCCSGLRVTAEVDEEDIALVKPNQDVVIKADAYPNETFLGKVKSITPKGDPVARSYRVRIELDKEDTKLMIGMTAEANIEISKQQNSIIIPSSAIKDSYVYIVKNNRAVKTKVEILAKSQNGIAIKEGLGESDTIIIDASQSIPEDQPLSIFYVLEDKG